MNNITIFNELKPNEVFQLFWESIPPSALDKFTPVLTIFKAAGIVFIAYLIFVIVKSLWIFHVLKRLKYIEDKMDRMDDKLDLITKNVDDKGS